MYNIKLSNNCIWPFIRQTPGSTGQWHHYQFQIQQNIKECDYWVVYDALSAPEKVSCPVANTIFITGEPPFIKSYNPKFLRQFAIVISCHNIDHPNVLHLPPALPWFVNKDYDTLKSIRDLRKDRLISVVTSNKWPNRSDFIYKLKNYFGNEINLFGRGINEIADKWEGVSRYKYHIALENCVYPHYWTEKIADPFLGLSYPFYHGCPNLADYFSIDSFTAIDINDFDAAIRSIEKAISENYYEQKKEQLLASRNLVLDKYNLFPFIVNLCAQMPTTNEKIPITLYPEESFSR
jgi:hypothetical protein